MGKNHESWDMLTVRRVKLNPPWILSLDLLLRSSDLSNFCEFYEFSCLSETVRVEAINLGHTYILNRVKLNSTINTENLPTFYGSLTCQVFTFSCFLENTTARSTELGPCIQLLE